MKNNQIIHTHIKINIRKRLADFLAYWNSASHSISILCDGLISLVILAKRLKYDQSLSNPSPSVNPNPVT